MMYYPNYPAFGPIMAIILFCFMFFIIFLCIAGVCFFLFGNNKSNEMAQGGAIIGEDIEMAFIATAEEVWKKFKDSSEKDSKEIVNFAKDTINQKLSEVEKKYKEKEKTEKSNNKAVKETKAETKKEEK